MRNDKLPMKYNREMGKLLQRVYLQGRSDQLKQTITEFRASIPKRKRKARAKK
jgi:hypothetical protein